MTASIWEYTDSKLQREFPEAWADGFAQGKNPECGTPERPYRNPHEPNTPAFWAWNKGCWWGFCCSDDEVLSER